jgi:hypothetical protein
MRRRITRRSGGGRPDARRPPPAGADEGLGNCDGAPAYRFGRMSPVSMYRLWNPNASLNMCGDWRPALGFA